MPRVTKQQKLLKKFQKAENDTGSTSVQIITLTEKIVELAVHLKEHRKDFDSRVGLLKLLGKRRRLLNYLKKTDETEYLKLVKDLNLRK